METNLLGPKVFKYHLLRAICIPGEGSIPTARYAQDEFQRLLRETAVPKLPAGLRALHEEAGGVALRVSIYIYMYIW